jgi:hypothetical protein
MDNSAGEKIQAVLRGLWGGIGKGKSRKACQPAQK